MPFKIIENPKTFKYPSNEIVDDVLRKYRTIIPELEDVLKQYEFKDKVEGVKDTTGKKKQGFRCIWSDN